MTTTLQFYDETNSLVLFDLNDPTGANASDTGYSQTYLGSNLDLGSPSFEFERFNPPQSDGGSTTFKRAGMRQLTIPLMIVASTYDNYAQAVGRLAQLCYSGGVLKFTPDGSSNTRYIDVEPSPTPFYLDGRTVSLYEAVRLFGRGSGITLSLTAQPYLRGAELDSASNLFTNATLLRDADLGGRPDGWTWSSTSNISNENIDATAEAFEFDMAVSGANRSLTNSTAAASAAVGQDWTVSGYVRVSSSTMTNARAQAMLTWRTSAPADISTITGTLTALTTAWQRFSISGTAPATTDRIQGGMRFNNTSATSATIQMKNLQVEMTTSATPFHVGSEVGAIDPEPSSGMGRVFPFYNPSDALVPVNLRIGNTTAASLAWWVCTGSNPSGQVGNGYLSDYLNVGHYDQFEDWTNGTDTAGSVQANSSPGSGTSAKLVTFATTTLVSRATRTITTAAVLRALAGRTWRVFVRATGSGGSYAGTMQLKTKWGSGDQQTVLEYTAGVISTAYSDLNFGLITFDRDIPDQIEFDFLASKTTNNLILDVLTFAPADAGQAFIGSGSGSTTRHYLTNPEKPGTALVTTSGGALYNPSVTTRGPVPFMAPPGLSMVYVVSSSGGTAEQSVFNARNEVVTLASKFSPRYLT